MSRRSSNMIVKRIVTNFAATDVSKARHFYADILGLEVVMDHGWIVTFASPAQMAPQVSVATEGRSGTPVPDISIEVDDPDEVERRVREAGLAAVEGRLPRGIGVATLRDAPDEWSLQFERLGLAQP